jgi:hypothetical protein
MISGCTLFFADGTSACPDLLSLELFPVDSHLLIPASLRLKPGSYILKIPGKADLRIYLWVIGREKGWFRLE